MGLLDGLFGGKRVAPITTSAPNIESTEIAALRASNAKLTQEIARLQLAIKNLKSATDSAPASEIDATSITTVLEDFCDQSVPSEGVDDPLELRPETNKQTLDKPSELESMRLMLEQTKRAEAFARVSIAIRRLLTDRLAAELRDSQCEISRLCDDELAQLRIRDARAIEEKEKSDSLLLQASRVEQRLEAELRTVSEKLTRAYQANAKAHYAALEVETLKARVRDLEDERTELAPLQRLIKDLRARVDAAEIENGHLRRGESREVSDMRKNSDRLKLELESAELELESAEELIKKYESTIATQLADKRQLMSELGAAKASLTYEQKERQKLAGQASTTKRDFTSLQDPLLKLFSWPEWFNSKILQWIFAETQPTDLKVRHGYLSLMGNGPWARDVLGGELESQGFNLWQLPDADVKHIIVGREDWDETSLEEQIQCWNEGGLRIYSQEMWFAAMATGRDPFDAEDHDLLMSFARGHPALESLIRRDPMPWPEVGVFNGPVTEVDTGELGVDESPMHRLGYKVGRSSPYSEEERHAILREVFLTRDLPFGDDCSTSYRRNWGAAGSAQRLYRMAMHIKYVVDGPNGHDRRKQVAREHWLHDLNWLKATYYRKKVYSFNWPGADIY